MASVYRRTGAKKWTANYRTASGSFRRRATGEKTKSAALKMACEWEEAERRIEYAGAEDQIRIAAILAEAGRLASLQSLSIAKARQMLSEIAEMSTGEPLSSPSVRRWGEQWLTEKKTTTSPATYARYSSSIKRFNQYLGAKVDAVIEMVSTETIRKFRDELKSEGRAGRTCNHYLADVRACLREAVREGLLTSNPAEGVKSLDTKDSIPRLPFTLAEVGKLAAAADAQWQGLVLLGAYTGLRLRDAADLTWSSVDQLKHLISLTQRKTGSEVVIPMHPTLVAYFERLAASDVETAGVIFPDLAKRYTGGKGGLSLEFTNLMKTAKVPRKATVAGRNGVRSFHSLRHTAASLMAEAGVPEDMRMRITGHESKEVHRHYTHHEIEALRKAVSSMPAFDESSAGND